MQDFKNIVHNQHLMILLEDWAADTFTQLRLTEDGQTRIIEDGTDRETE